MYIIITFDMPKTYHVGSLKAFTTHFHLQAMNMSL